MVESDFAEKIEIEELQIESTDVMTGDRNKRRFLYYQLKMSMRKATRIDIIVSFLMESGVRMILKDLKYFFSPSWMCRTEEWSAQRHCFGSEDPRVI